MAEVVITEVSLEPNPVNTNSDYKISLYAVNRVHGILAKDGKLIMAKNGKAIERKEA